MLDNRSIFLVRKRIFPLTVRTPIADAGWRSGSGTRAAAVDSRRRRTAMVVERREAQRARNRRFAQADCSVARATPEAGAGGNIRARGVAHDPGASRRSTPLFLRYLV